MAAATALLLAGTGCHGLLDVSNPMVVQDQDIANAAGADARRLSVFQSFQATIPSRARDVAVFSDEITIDAPVFYLGIADPDRLLDRRDSQGFEAYYGRGINNDDPYLGGWDNIVTKSSIALPAVRAYTPDSLKGDYLAELHAMRGYAILAIAEDVCPGFPINDVANNLPVYSKPYTTDSALNAAIASFDSVIADAHDSTELVNMASVAKGRALLDLGKYPEAAAAVANVPPSFVYTNFTGDGLSSNIFYGAHYFWDPTGNNPRQQYAIGDTNGVNGLPFVSAHDPRVPTIYEQTRYINPADSLYDQLKYTSFTDPIVIASGLEAQLITAEADLNAGDPSWLTILNTLRASAGLAALQDPGTTAAQVDLLYRERAFWLFLTGRRLGDIRRLIRNYGRDPETVFPTGSYPMGGQYSNGTAIPFIQSSEGRLNSNITTGCTTR